MSRNTKEFNRLAEEFSTRYAQQRIELERCLERRVNDDINFVCQRQKSAYLEGIARTFCLAEYNAGVKCQQAAKERWATDCFTENVAFGKCSDKALKQLYIFNLEQHKKNPAAGGAE